MTSGEHKHEDLAEMVATGFRIVHDSLQDLFERVEALEGAAQPEPEPEPVVSVSWERPFTGFHKRKIRPEWRRVESQHLQRYGEGGDEYPGFPNANKIGMSGSTREDCYFLDARVDPVEVTVYKNKHWNDRCGGTHFQGKLMMPRNWRDGIVHASPGHTPNNQITVLQPDGKTIFIIKAGDHCGPTTASGWLSGPYSIEDDIHDVSARGAARFGSGCELRAPDLTGNGPIEHAVLILPSAHMLFGARPENGGHNETGHPGYVWPARGADANYDKHHSASTYKGRTPELTMGSILTLRDDYVPRRLSSLFDRYMEAIRTRGAVIGDISAWGTQFCYIGIDARYKAEFDAQWGDAEKEGFIDAIRHTEIVVPPEAERG